MCLPSDHAPGKPPARPLAVLWRLWCPRRVLLFTQNCLPGSLPTGQLDMKWNGCSFFPNDTVHQTDFGLITWKFHLHCGSHTCLLTGAPFLFVFQGPQDAKELKAVLLLTWPLFCYGLNSNCWINKAPARITHPPMLKFQSSKSLCSDNYFSERKKTSISQTVHLVSPFRNRCSHKLIFSQE